MKTEIQGDTYKERVAIQISEWVKGNSLHNRIDDECCPDFSCCNKSVKTDETIRKTFKAACDKGDENLKMQMLGQFLGSALETLGKKNVYIAGSTSSESVNN